MAEAEMDLTIVTETDDIENMYLTFDIAKETYAVNIGYVTEIVGMQHISAMPDVPEFIKGAMNLRGKVIPVMDLRLRFQMPARDYDERTTIIVLDMEGSATGLVVDHVSDVLTIPADKIDPPPQWRKESQSSEAAARQGVIRGLGKQNDGVSIILDVPRLLAYKEVKIATAV
jgi:purine-binding chemotaxis protein CheW